MLFGLLFAEKKVLFGPTTRCQEGESQTPCSYVWQMAQNFSSSCGMASGLETCAKAGSIVLFKCVRMRAAITRKLHVSQHFPWAIGAAL